MAEVLITYKAEADSLEAVVKEAVKGNVAIAESATKAGQVASKAFKEVGSSAKAAFASQETSKQLAKLGSESKKVILEIKSTFENVKTSAAKTAVSLKEQVANLNASRAAAVKNNKEAVESIKVAKTFTNQVQDQAKAVDNNTAKTTSLRTQLKNLKAELSALDDAGKGATKEFGQLAIAAAKLEDQIGDTNERVKTLASDTFAFDAAVESVRGLTGAFTAVQGAVGLFAEDNEELQKAIAASTSAMAILTGVQEVANIVTGQGAAKLGVLTAAQSAFAFVTGTSTGALKVFRIALAATGIGLIVVALVAAYEAFKAFGEASENAAASAENLNATLKETQKILNDNAKAALSNEDKLKVQRGQIREATAEENALIRENLNARNEAYKVQFAANEKLKRDQAALIEQSNKFNPFAGFTKGGAEGAIKKTQEQIKKNEDLILKGEQALVNIKTSFAKNLGDEIALIEGEDAKKRIEEGKKIAKEAADKAAEAAKKAAEDLAKAREKLLQLEADVFKSSLDEQSKILAESNDQILELEKTFREAKFKKGSAEEIQAQKDLQNAIEEIKKQATAKNIELEKQSQEKILAAKLEAAKAAEGATLQVQLAALQNQQTLELESADALGKSKLEITTRYGLLIANVNKQIGDAILNTQLNNLKTLEIAEGTSLERRIELININAEKRKTDATNSIKDEKELSSAIALINAETQQAITNETKTENQKRIDEVLNYAQAFAGVLNQLNELSAQLSQNRIAEITTEKDAQLKAINESFDTERSKIRQREALELKANKQIAAEKTKQAKADKALALFNAAINTSVAITKAAPNPFLIALAAALGLAQIALIAAKPIPKFDQGGVVGGKLHSQGGTQIEAEKDEYIVKRSQSVKHRKELDAINTSTQAFRAMIEQRYVRPAIMNYVLNRKQDQGVTINASLNSKSMENELKGLRKDIRNSRTRMISSQFDSRYSWQ
jgi:hypothetical protein